MALPTLLSIEPSEGPASGGDLVRVTGRQFASQVAISFGGLPVAVTAVREEAGLSIADVRVPAHEAGTVEVTVQNLDASGAPIDGESATLPAGYRYLRAQLADESDLTRIVRQLLRELKRQVVANVSTTVSIDYDDTPAEGVIAVATVPSIVLSGPSLRVNRFFSTNERREEAALGPSGPELARRCSPLTVDLVFTLTVTSSRTAELLNLMAAVATFLHRNRWVELDRDPDDLARGRVRWEMDAEGELRTELENKGDVRAFTWGFVVRGFDIDEGQVLDRARAVASTELEFYQLKDADQ
ncbi:MAG TPA: IPT/TIG domain-containing protein [Polyangiaceae bacterium]|nr:IPT/TIG domain-containing protein [Polyangiaceae bacterium]